MAPGSSGSPRKKSRHEPPSFFGRLRQRNVSGTSTIGFCGCARCSSTSAGNGSGNEVTAEGSVRGALKKTIAASPLRTDSTTLATSPPPFALICGPPRYQRRIQAKSRYPSPVAARASGRPSFQKVQLKYSKCNKEDERRT